jgi:hypothetical protein
MDYPNELKIGTMFASSDVLDKMSLFGGIAANRKLDVDAFGIFDVKRWTPTIFLEAYYQRRHVDDRGPKVVFDLVEVETGAECRISDYQKLRLEYDFSRYHATQTIDERLNLEMPYTYHIGNSLRAKWNLEAVPRSLISDIAPDRGCRIRIQIENDWQRFLSGFQVSQKFGTTVGVYRPYIYRQIQFDWRQYLPALFRDHSLALRLSAGYIDRPVDDFYHLFGGGLEGLKGYPYYGIEGTKQFQLAAAYRLPIFQHAGWRVLGQSFDRMFISLYSEAGDAWIKGGINSSDWKRDVGVQLRMDTVSFYSYPLKWFFDAAYGLDRFTNQGQTYGKGWRTYFGILFDFLD